MVQLLAGDPYVNSGWLFSLSELPGVYWTQIGSIQASITRGNWADPISGILRNNKSGAISYPDITITKPFMQESQQGEIDNWDIIKSLNSWLNSGENLSGALSPVIRDRGIQLIGTNSIQMENLKVASLDIPGDVDVADGSTSSTITCTLSVEYIRI